MENSLTLKPKYFVLDVDGVLTNGQFIYNVNGKVAKTFGADDNDALSLLKDILEICFITGDKRGFPISKKRIVDDMHFPLDLVSTFDRFSWFEKNVVPAETIFMGDGILDALVFPHVAYSIAPANGFYKTRQQA